MASRKLLGTSDIGCATIVLFHVSLAIICFYNPPVKSAYRHKNADLLIFLVYILKRLPNQCHIIVSGDFSEPHACWIAFDSNTGFSEFLDFLFQKNLCPLVSFPTHISRNILDQILSNIADVASSDCYAHMVDFSDHFAVTLRFELDGVLNSNMLTETMTIPSSSFSDLKLIFSTALFSLIKSTEDPMYTDLLLYQFNQLLLPFFERKRSKRLTYLSYY